MQACCSRLQNICVEDKMSPVQWHFLEPENEVLWSINWKLTWPCTAVCSSAINEPQFGSRVNIFWNVQRNCHVGTCPGGNQQCSYHQSSCSCSCSSGRRQTIWYTDTHAGVNIIVSRPEIGIRPAQINLGRVAEEHADQTCRHVWNLPFALRNVSEWLSHSVKKRPLVTGQRGGKFHHCFKI